MQTKWDDILRKLRNSDEETPGICTTSPTLTYASSTASSPFTISSTPVEKRISSTEIERQAQAWAARYVLMLAEAIVTPPSGKEKVVAIKDVMKFLHGIVEENS